MCSDQTRTYDRNNCIVFLKTKEAFGGLSNMAGGFPLRVNGIRIFTSEALYQACRFPHMPEVQRIVLGEPSPMTSKMKSKPHRKNSRPDWGQVRVRVMRWCLRIKLAQNWKTFGDLLLATDDKPIVEESRKDDFWGANPVDEHTLVGMNVLGRLLMELREELKSDRHDELLRIEPLPIPDFLLMGQPIPVIEALAQDSKRLAPGVSAGSVSQTKLFDQPALFDGKATAIPMHEVNEFMPPAYENSYSAITTLKPYPEYKDSGLPWLEKVPGHWRLTPNRALMHRRKVLVGERHTNYKLLSLTKLGVIIRDISTGKGKFSSDMGTSQEVRKGDLVFCLFDVPETPRTVGLSSYDGMITGAYTVFECSAPLLARFLDCYYRAMDDRKLLSPLYSGLRHTIPPTRFLGTKTAIPPIDEQATIVRFLDHATRRLDKAIRDKRKIIALLNEQKQAIIHRAVTRGLDPDVPLKDSGIPWLGQIPAHWEVLPFKFLCRRIQNGATPSSSEQHYYEDGTVPWFGPSSINTGHELGAPVRYLTKAAFADGKARLIRSPAILVIVIGATAGKMGLLKGEGATNQQITAFELKQGSLDPEFVIQQLRIAEGWLKSTASTATIPILDSGVVNRLPVALPKTDSEQKEIVAAIYEEAQPLTAAMLRQVREIGLLREYRTRLIADVVTGKLDVREAAAYLPDEVEVLDILPEPDTDDAEGALDIAEALDE